jgi:hypothetical protein
MSDLSPGDVDRLVSSLQTMVETSLSGVNTSMPGVVVSYNAGTGRAAVRPSLPKQLADGRSLPAPEIVEVPVIWPTAGGATMTMPIRPGDPVLLHFAQRSTEGWLSGDNSAPDDPRMHDLTDAFASPGLTASRNADPENFVLSFEGASITFKPGGIISIKATAIEIDAPNTTSTGDIKAQLISLLTHRHTGVVSGGALSAGPVP